jgi:hypothetical protein
MKRGIFLRSAHFRRRQSSRVALWYRFRFPLALAEFHYSGGLFSGLMLGT